MKKESGVKKLMVGKMYWLALLENFLNIKSVWLWFTFRNDEC